MNSLEKFATISFDLVYMKSLIRIDAVKVGAIDARMWFALVPECYRVQVMRIVEAVFREFCEHGIPNLMSESLERFIVALHRQIWSYVTPILPGHASEP